MNSAQRLAQRMREGQEKYHPKELKGSFYKMEGEELYTCPLTTAAIALLPLEDLSILEKRYSIYQKRVIRDEVLKTLEKDLDIDATVECPYECPITIYGEFYLADDYEEDRNYTSGLRQAVVHLTDDHNWTRQQVIDWLDSVDLEGE